MSVKVVPVLRCILSGTPNRIRTLVCPATFLSPTDWENVLFDQTDKLISEGREGRAYLSSDHVFLVSFFNIYYMLK